MVGIQALHARGKAVIVGQPAIVPFHLARAVYALAKVKITIGHRGRSHVCHQQQRVAGHMERKRGVVERQPVQLYLPLVAALGRVGGHRIAQRHVQPGIAQHGLIYPHQGAPQVYAVCPQQELPHAAAHPCGGDKRTRIESYIGQRKLVDVHLALQKGQQADIGHHPRDGCHGICMRRQRIVGSQGHHIFYCQVEGESQSHPVDGDGHARLLRGIRCGLLDRPPLERREVKQECQQQE